LGEAALPMTSRRVLLIGTGFQEVRVERQWREGSFDSFDEYWDIAVARRGGAVRRAGPSGGPALLAGQANRGQRLRLL
jgi:hypothetical protein